MRARELSDNPFQPGFGESPPILAGRGPLLDAYEASFAPGGWRPYRAVVLQGHRGIGKTSLLTAMEHRARAAGWPVASITARPGVVGDLIDDRLPRLARGFDARRVETSVTGVGFAGVSVQRSVTRRHTGGTTLRGSIEDLLDVPGVPGLLISIDELNADAITDLREIADAVQHAIREGRPVRMLTAGLYPDVTKLLHASGVTFLHRSTKVDVPLLTFDEAHEAIRRPVESGGRLIDPDTLDYAVAISQGYPYLTQVIGAVAWAANADEIEISRDDVMVAHSAAVPRMGEDVLRPTLRELTETNGKGALFDYLVAMSHDAGASPAAALAARLGLSSSSLANRRSRLLDERLIVPAGHGYVDYALPYLREHLQSVHRETEHARLAERRLTFGPPPPLPPELNA